MSNSLTDEELLTQLAELLQKYGDDLSKRQFTALQERRCGLDSYLLRWGSWVTAKEAAKLYAETGQFEPKRMPLDLLKSQNDRLLHELQLEKQRTELIVEACQAVIGKFDLKPVRPAKKIKVQQEQEFHALRSDEQVGLVVEPSRTQGVGKYDFETYKNRLLRWTEKVLLFKDQDSSSLGLNKLVICRLGDHVEGEAIYPGQAFYIDRPVVDQIFQSVEAETDSILALAGAFNTIEVFCVPGNHGRIGKKGQHHERTNWDYISSRVLKMCLSHQSNVSVYVSEDPVMIVRHGAYIFCYKHGANIRSWMSIPFYGLERDFQRLASLYNMIIHYECIGHHHQPANIKDNMFINGCFPGGTQLSVNQMATAARPSQKIFYFDHERGVNRESNIYLEDPVEMEPDERGIYTEYV